MGKKGVWGGGNSTGRFLACRISKSGRNFSNSWVFSESGFFGKVVVLALEKPEK